MAKKRSEKQSYPSRYSIGGWVTAHQYITELICENKALREGKELPTEFWNLREWKSYFQRQIIRVSQLLRKYKAKAVIQIVREKRIYSIYPKWIEGLIEEVDKKLPSTDNDVETTRDRTNVSSKGSFSKSKNVFDLLD